MLGFVEAGTLGGGAWETIVVFSDSALIVVESVFDDESWAGMEGKLVLPAGVLTVTSKCPGVVATMWTVTTWTEVASVCRVMMRSYLSPPNLRDGREAQGEVLPVAAGAPWSRRAMKSAA